MIEVEGVSKNFGWVTAVRDVSFSIKSGEVVGFLGPNGAGKTTTMRILTCYLPPDSGEVRVADFDVFEQSMEVRRRIGYLPENAPLYPDMNVDGFLRYAAALRGVPETDREAALERMLAVCGLREAARKRIGELSKGYRQRVGLAQAMIHDPDILILDEPTSGLDPNQISEVRELIRTLGREKTVILSTHILSEVEAVCNRVIVINKGRIVEDGTIESVTGRAQSGNLHLAVLRGDPGKIEQGLGKISGVISFSCLRSEGDLHTYQVIAREGLHLGETIFKMAADSGLSLSELRRERAALESAFAQLTRNFDADREGGE